LGVAIFFWSTEVEEFLTTQFWLAVGQIIMIDILLGGDNAVVIALACRKLPPAQRRLGILWGTAGAIGLRVILIIFALALLAIPYLKIVGAALLVWIGVKLLAPDDEEEHGNIQSSDKLWSAVKTVIVADLVMSIDNVIAIAGAAEGAGGDHKIPLVIFGLLVSIPIIVWGSQLVIKLMERFPVIIVAGGMLLGWIAGGMVVTDPAVMPHLATEAVAGKAALQLPSWMGYAAGLAGAALVFAAGQAIKMKRRSAMPTA
jgi:YjbE family integral membrane protein